MSMSVEVHAWKVPRWPTPHARTRLRFANVLLGNAKLNAYHLHELLPRDEPRFVGVHDIVKLEKHGLRMRILIELARRHVEFDGEGVDLGLSRQPGIHMRNEARSAQCWILTGQKGHADGRAGA